MVWPFWVGVEPMVGVSPRDVCSLWRRHHAHSAQSAGDSTGAVGESVASEASFTHASTFDTTPVTADAGGSGALALGGIECATKTDCGESVLAATAGSAGAARCTPASVTTDRVGGVPGGDGALISADDGWSATSLGTAIVFNDDRFGFLRVVTDAGDDQSVPDLLTGAVSLAVVVGSGVTVGEAVVGSGPESSPADESPPVAVDPEVLLDVEPDVDVDPEVPLDVVLLDDEPDVDVDPDESGEDFEPDESDEDADPASGSANATPGVVATANPTPNATANPPTRPIYLA